MARRKAEPRDERIYMFKVSPSFAAMSAGLILQGSTQRRFLHDGVRRSGDGENAVA